MLNFRTILRILGSVLMIEGFFMWLTIPVSLIYREQDALHFLLSGGITFLTGLVSYLSTQNALLEISKRDGYLIVTSGWIVFSLFGTLPFILTRSIQGFTDAFFETMSGFSTTGASILNNIEELSHAMLFWRSIIQWLGGMGIILLSLIILPFLGIGGMQLFSAEVPGPTPDKLHPRVKDTAKRLWFIYLIFTLSETILLWIGDMDLFDAICHSFTTMATGGFSTKQASIAYWNSPYIHYIIILFMFLAGTNFTLSYFAMHLRFKKIWENEEFRYYVGFIAGFSVIITIGLIFHSGVKPEQAFRDALFQVVSILTTTGFVTSDYLTWIPALGALIFILMFFGGSAGSTGGGPKIMRIVILLKNSTQELKRMIHPSAVIPVRLSKQGIDQGVVTNILAFLAFYVVIAIVSMFIMTLLGCNIDTAIGSVAATLGNIGPGIGDVGPVHNYVGIHTAGKWYLSFLMLVGRLELFTVLVLFAPMFWKK
ncbi:MAG: TrkH family potassium uptake protein [Bacteroidales bacterium]|nr:TrkH family potassium uptake protein [Bacteroidales bacterium]MBN2699502.1 TrkH family potassium uptake protein [Bacteroidales bacterium]